MSPEFSRRVRIEEITGAGLDRKVSAREEERAALAERFGIVALPHLTAEVHLRPTGQGVVLKGALQAEVEQSCVITLEPLKSNIASRFAVRYISPHIEVADAAGEELDPLGDDVEPLPADAIDIGEVVAQYLALEIDPYPRKPGAEAAPDGVLDAAGEEPSSRPNPFAVLKKLRDGG